MPIRFTPSRERMYDPECPECGSKDLEVFAPTPFGYKCRECGLDFEYNMPYPDDD